MKPSVESTTIRKGSKSDDAVMIFVYVVARLVGIWCVYHVVRFGVHVQYFVNKRPALRAELNLIQTSLTGRSLHHPRPCTPENLSARLFVLFPM